MHIAQLTILLRVMAALVCGALLGAEREYRGREAGLKSHAGLSVACCLAIMVSAFGFSDAVTTDLISLDPSRIAAGVEGGIGFACAAVIWRSRSKVIGLTTAINIWATANIGMACGAGMFFAGILITIVMLFIHLVLPTIERLYFPRHDACTLTLMVKDGTNNTTEQIGHLITSIHATLLTIHINQGEMGQPTSIEIELAKCPTVSYLRLVDSLRRADGVLTVSCNGICVPE